MVRSIAVLLEIRPDDTEDLCELLELVRQQEAASHRAGFDHVARLCRSMGDCLEGVRRGDQPGTVAVLDTLLDVCRAVENHAHAIAATVAMPCYGSSSGRSSGRGGAETPWPL
ncbi:MAG TPA: hypothetical protein VMY42_14190 [Thermoguttaceae bacterium]|nr:hypothetical protein [Thermoguttaceae bacterium]